MIMIKNLYAAALATKDMRTIISSPKLKGAIRKVGAIQLWLSHPINGVHWILIILETLPKNLQILVLIIMTLRSVSVIYALVEDICVRYMELLQI